MSVLRVIRHGQASYFDDDYDALSPIGWEQARSLGRHWLAQGLGVDRVVLGPRRRHRETMEAVAEVFREHGREWPEPELMDELDEHCGQQVVDRTLREWIAERPELERLAERKPEDLRLYFRVFREITVRWVRGALSALDDLESWESFRARVTRGLERILHGSVRGHDVVVFTSGGPVATAAGLALDLADEKVLELSWRVRNTAHAELLFSEDGVTLDTFNANPHLTEPRLVTYI
jgi:broad specificity phosphatase PhoE